MAPSAYLGQTIKKGKAKHSEEPEAQDRAAVQNTTLPTKVAIVNLQPHASPGEERTSNDVVKLKFGTSYKGSLNPAHS